MCGGRKGNEVHKGDDKSRAVRLVAPLVPLLGQSYEQQLAQSQSALSAKQYKEAQAAADRAIKLDPNRWEGYLLAANAYSSQRLYDDAIGMLQLALPRAPEDKKPLIREALADARKQAAGRPPENGAIADGPSRAEIVLWTSVKDSARSSDFLAYLEKYPNGTFVPVAKSRINELTSYTVSDWALTRMSEADLRTFAKTTNCAKPVSNTNFSFSDLTEDRIWLWLKVDGQKIGDTFNVLWYTPDGRYYLQNPEQVRFDGMTCFFSGLLISRHGPPENQPLWKQAGAWTLRITANEIQKLRIGFVVLKE